MFDDKLKVTEYEISSDKLPTGFDGFTIIQLSDLHCKKFGKEQSKLIERIKDEAPGIIVITGDMYDSQRWNYDNIKDLLQGICRIAPVYSVTGNHEYDDAQMFDTLLKLYREYGVTMLSNMSREISLGGDHINLYGIPFRDGINVSDKSILPKEQEFNIMLSHDPLQINYLMNYNFDLVLAGHTHGGVIRLPFLGGMIGTRGELFPKYAYGYYKEAGTAMIVSTGLGDTFIPRVLNRPEIVKIILKKG